MGKHWRQYCNSSTLLITAAVVSCTGYLLLLIQGHTRHETDATRIIELEQYRQELHHDLSGKNYTIDRLERELNALQTQNWESKFTSAQSDYRTLEQQQRINLAEIDRLNRATTFLNQNNELVRSELALSRVVYQELESEYLAAKTELRKKQKQTQQQPVSTEAITTTVSQQEVSLENNAGISHPISIPAPDYRQVRLQSLNKAMQGQSSSNRRNILSNVLATVPGGFTGEELLPLITGMNSSDILLLLQSTNQYLQRPVEPQTMEAIYKNMNETDALSAQNLLVIKQSESGFTNQHRR